MNVKSVDEERRATAAANQDINVESEKRREKDYVWKQVCNPQSRPPLRTKPKRVKTVVCAAVNAKQELLRVYKMYNKFHISLDLWILIIYILGKFAATLLFSSRERRQRWFCVRSLCDD